MSVVAGQRYSGAWDDGSYRYDLVLGFTAVDRKHNVEGTTEWTHRSGLGDEKAGKTAVESWKGKLKRGKLHLQGYATRDPDGLIDKGKYELTLSKEAGALGADSLKGTCAGTEIALQREEGGDDGEPDLEAGGEPGQDAELSADEGDRPEPEEWGPEPEPEPEPAAGKPAERLAEALGIEFEAAREMIRDAKAGDADLRVKIRDAIGFEVAEPDIESRPVSIATGRSSVLTEAAQMKEQQELEDAAHARHHSPVGEDLRLIKLFASVRPRFFVLFFCLVPSLAGLREHESYHRVGQEYFAECRKQSLKPHKSVVDWIAACHLGICKILDGDPFSMLDLTVAAENAEGKTGPYYVPPEQLQAVLLAFGPVCGVADIQEVVLRGAIQSPAAALVAATMIEANSSIVSWDLSYNSAIEDVSALEALLGGLRKSLAVEELNLCRIWPSTPPELSMEFTQLLADAVRELPRLKTLRFSFKPTGKQDSGESDDGSRAGSRLSSVELGAMAGDGVGSDDVLLPLIDAIADSDTLGTIDIQHCELGKACGDVVDRMLRADALSEVPQLVSISVAHNAMFHGGMKRLAQAVMDNSTLTDLDVSANNGGPEAVAALCDALLTTQVVKLDLSLNNAGVPGTQSLIPLVKQGKLEELEYSYNGVGWKCGQQLLKACVEAPVLRELGLGGNGLTDTAGPTLIKLLGAHPVLRIVRVPNNQIGTRTCEAIVKKMEEHHHIKYVQIEPGSITREEVATELWKLNFRRCRQAHLPLPPPVGHSKIAAPNEHDSEQRARYLHGGWQLKAKRRRLLCSARCVCPRCCGRCAQRCSRCGECCVGCVGSICSCVGSCCRAIVSCLLCTSCRSCEKPEWCYNLKLRNVWYLLKRPKACMAALGRLLISPCVWCCSGGGACVDGAMAGFTRCGKGVRRRVLGEETDGWPLAEGRPVLASFEPGRTRAQACDPMLKFEQ